MSTRYALNPFDVVVNASMGASVTSAVTIKSQIPLVNYSVVFTGTPTGTFTVEGSDDYSLDAQGNVKNSGTWNTLPTTPAVTASGSGGNGMLEITTGAYATRLVYTRTSGTGTLNAKVTGMVL